MTGKIQNAYAIILAAGSSRRMRRPKAELPWLEDQALLSWMGAQLYSAGWTPVAVTRSNYAWFPFAQVVNPDPERGKSSSLILGVSAVPLDASWILITAVDQPRPVAVYRLLLEAACDRSDSVITPEYLGRRGHPLVVSARLREELLSVREESEGLRSLLNEYRKETWCVPGCEPGWLQWDLNEEGEYVRALRYFRENVCCR